MLPMPPKAPPSAPCAPCAGWAAPGAAKPGAANPGRFGGPPGVEIGGWKPDGGVGVWPSCRTGGPDGTPGAAETTLPPGPHVCPTPGPKALAKGETSGPRPPGGPIGAAATTGGAGAAAFGFAAPEYV